MRLDHAIVIGGSFAGLVTARVLSECFGQVTIVERDVLPDGPSLRKGVPQGSHVHGILHLGRVILDDVFPGFVNETEAEGAFLFDQLAYFGIGSGDVVKGYAARRPLLEYVARRRVQVLPNVEFVMGRVEGLSVRSGNRVGGVVVGDTSIDADLVVDASGRGSAAPAWLERAGFEAPSETLVNAFGGYASRLLMVPDDAWPDNRRVLAQLPMPSNTKGAILYPQDNGLYIISLFGQSRDYPPDDEEGFEAFLAMSAQPLTLRWFHNRNLSAKFERRARPPTGGGTTRRWRTRRKALSLSEMRPPPSTP